MAYNPLAGLMAMLPRSTPVDTGESMGDAGDVGGGNVPIPGAAGPMLPGAGGPILPEGAIARRIGGLTMPGTSLPGFSMPSGPRLPSPGRVPRGIPAAVAAPASTKAGGGEGGGMNLDTVMPMLLLLSPLLELYRPGYGVGLAQGVLAHQANIRDTRQKTIFALAQDFAKVSPDQKDIMKAAFRNVNIAPDIFDAAWQLGQATRDPHAENERKLQEILRPFIEEANLTHKPFDPTQMPIEQFRKAQELGGFPTYQERQGVIAPGTSGAPGIAPQPRDIQGPSGALTSPVGYQAPTPPVMGPQIVRRGEQPVPTFVQIFPNATGPFANAPIPMKNGVPDLNEATVIATRFGWIKTPADRREEDALAEKHKTQYQEFLRGKLEAGLDKPGSVDLATLRAQMESPDAGMNFASELRKAQNVIAQQAAKLPVQVVLPGGVTLNVSQDRALTYAENAQKQTREDALRIPVPELGGRALSPTEYIAWSHLKLAKEKQDQDAKLTPAERNTMWQQSYTQAVNEVLGKRGGAFSVGADGQIQLGGGQPPMTQDDIDKINKRTQEIYTGRLGVTTGQPLPTSTPAPARVNGATTYQTNRDGLVNAIYQAEGAGKVAPEWKGKLDNKQWIGQQIDTYFKQWTAAGKPGDFLQWTANKWAPIGAKNDPQGKNRNWYPNVVKALTPSAAAPPGTPPPAGQKTITRLQLTTIALNNKMSVADVQKQYEAGGYTVVP